MSERPYNFSAGPAVLPPQVLQEAREALLDLDGSGIGVLEHSHRGEVFRRVLDEAEAACRELAQIPEDYAVLFLQGGAATQFHMLPANFLPADGVADYLVTGAWSKKALAEARHYGAVHIAASGEKGGFRAIPGAADIACSAAPAYVHFTSNNTIYGTQWAREPEPPELSWLACDASSDIFSRPIEIARYGLLYAGAQKNLGPAGVTLVVLRRALLQRAARELPAMLRYALHAENNSLYNTPPAFGIYVMGRVFAWLQRQGGLAEMARRNAEKAQIVYAAVDGDFYRAVAHPDSRSHMNAVFRTPSAELDSRFVREAEAAGLQGLRGHRSVGGMRASLYNAFPRAGCLALAEFMRHFARRAG